VLRVRAPTEPDDIAMVLDALPIPIERVQETGGAESGWTLFQAGSPRPRAGRDPQASPSALREKHAKDQSSGDVDTRWRWHGSGDPCRLAPPPWSGCDQSPAR
jgi:hypothetical protein